MRNFYYTNRAFEDEIRYLTKNCNGSLEKIKDTLTFYGFKCKLVEVNDEEVGVLEVSKFGRKKFIQGYWH